MFAAIIPPIRKPHDARMDLLRKDHVFLLERYAYFLKERNESGLLVMDESEKSNDRQFVNQMERYFTLTQPGLERAEWIVPAVFFVESDMAYGVQLADVVIYSLNWAFRTPAMTKPKREELDALVKSLLPRIWRGKGKREAVEYDSRGVVFVPDPYENRQAQEKRR